MPISAPMGGGVDGPLYADYQDATDAQQTAGAASAMREKLNLVADTLALDIGKFCGDIKPQGSKAEGPIVPPFIKVRTAHSAGPQHQDPAETQSDFNRLMDNLSPKLRQLLLHNAQLPREERDPALNSLENMIKQHIALKQWAGRILKRLGKRQREDEEERRDQKGVFAELEEEESLPPGYKVPATEYVSIGKIDAWSMTPSAVEKQLQANSVFLVESQLEVLEWQINLLQPENPVRDLLRNFPSLIRKMLGRSKAFVDLRNIKDFAVAKKMAKGLENLGLKQLEEQHRLTERMLHYGLEGPDKHLVTYATAVMTSCTMACSLLRGSSSLSALQTDTVPLVQSYVLSHSKLIDSPGIELFHLTGRLLEGLKLQSERVKVLPFGLLIAVLLALFLPLQVELPFLLMGSLSESQKQKEEQLTYTIMLNLSLAAYVGGKSVYHTVLRLTEPDSKLAPATAALLFTLTVTCMAELLLERFGAATLTRFRLLAEDIVTQRTQALQTLADSLKDPEELSQILQSLRLGEWGLTSQSIRDKLTARDTALSKFKLSAQAILAGCQELTLVSGRLALDTLTMSEEGKQIIPHLNMI